MDNNKERRRIVIKNPLDPEPTKTAPTIVPESNSLINDALVVIGSELAYYRGKVKRGNTLDLKEARVLNQYVESLIKISKEIREAAKEHDFANMSTEEILELVKGLLDKQESKEQ